MAQKITLSVSVEGGLPSALAERLEAVASELAAEFPDARVELDRINSSRQFSAAKAPKAPKAPPPAPSEDSSDEAPSSEDPWALVAAGDFDAAVALLEGQELDSAGRDRVRLLMNAKEPHRMAGGFRLAGATGWKSAATNMRRHLVHPDKQVRLAAITAIGQLAGPGMIFPLQKLTDTDADIQAAVAAAVAAIESR